MSDRPIGNGSGRQRRRLLRKLSSDLSTTTLDLILLVLVRLVGLIFSLFLLTPILTRSFGTTGFATFSALLAAQFVLGLIDGAWLAIVGHGGNRSNVRVVFLVTAGSVIYAIASLLLLDVGDHDPVGNLIFVSTMGLYPSAALGLRRLMLAKRRRLGLFIVYLGWALAPLVCLVGVDAGLSETGAAGAWLVAPIVIGILAVLLLSQENSRSTSEVSGGEFLSQMLLQQSLIAVIQIAPMVLVLTQRTEEAAQIGMIFRLLFPIAALDGIVINSLRSRNQDHTSRLNQELVYLAPVLGVAAFWPLILLSNDATVLGYVTSGQIYIEPLSLILATLGWSTCLATRRLALISGMKSSPALVVAYFLFSAMVLSLFAADLSINSLLLLLTATQVLLGCALWLGRTKV